MNRDLEKFANEWTMFYRGKQLNLQYCLENDMRSTFLDFLKQSKWFIQAPMTKEDFDNDKYA